MESEQFFALWIISLLFLGGVLSLVSGIKHATSGTGTKVTNTVWLENHTYDASVATQTEPFKFVWKDASEQALLLTNQVATVNWTPLDLTAYTSANAKMAYVKVWVNLDTADTGALKELKVELRKNGTTPTENLSLKINGNMCDDNDEFEQCYIVGLDADEIIEYRMVESGTWQWDMMVSVLAYWE